MNVLPCFLLLGLLTGPFGSAQTSKQSNYLLMVTRPSPREAYGFRNLGGKMIIPFGRYPMIYTDTFRTHAIVFKPGEGFVAIDRREKVLYQVFPFDNGPDYPADGLYRIVKNGKIGYANTDGDIVITPQFSCAFPFDLGKAKVSDRCTTYKDGEHGVWISEHWYYIDKTGKKL